MKKARKALLTLCAALLLVSMTAGVTIAYLTSTDSVTNSFSVGKVKITLDEAPVDENGDVIEGNRRQENNYKLMPGTEYAKDPTVHVEANSEKCYVFIEVVNPIASLEATGNTTMAAQIAAKGWTEYAADDAAVGATVYYKVVEKATTQTDLVIFESFTLADEAATTDANGDPITFEPVTITAYAVQFDNLSVDEAWDNRATN